MFHIAHKSAKQSENLFLTEPASPNEPADQSKLSRANRLFSQSSSRPLHTCSHMHPHLAAAAAPHIRIISSCAVRCARSENRLFNYLPVFHTHTYTHICTLAPYTYIQLYTNSSTRVTPRLYQWEAARWQGVRSSHAVRNICSYIEGCART